MPLAARLGDMHSCPIVNGNVPHTGGPVAAGSGTVLIGNQPAARQGDSAMCNGPPDAIVAGSTTVLIDNVPAARMGDSTAHGGAVVVGCPTVMIGIPGQGAALMAAAATGAAFCEECEGGS